jgi:hypothetical protein
MAHLLFADKHVHIQVCVVMSESPLNKNSSEAQWKSTPEMPFNVPGSDNQTLHIKFGVPLNAEVDQTAFSCPLNITLPDKPFVAKFQMDVEPPSEPLKYATRILRLAEVGERHRLAALAAKLRRKGTVSLQREAEHKGTGARGLHDTHIRNLTEVALLCVCVYIYIYIYM